VNELEELIMKYVAVNALKYGKPNEKAVMGKIMAEKPELRKKAKETLEIVKECVKKFESLSEEEKRSILENIKEEKEEKKKEKILPELPNAKKGKVVMRFAPNPNGPPTLGSARGMVVNDEYVKIYDGKLVLRFDDTDPRTKRPLIEAYDWYIEDAEWLDVKPNEIVYASKRIPIYYEYIEKLLEMEKAYPCFCSRDEFKKYRDSGIECPHRCTSAEEALEIWEKMLAGEYDEGEVVIRIKTDMKHKDPAIRDWVAFRIIKADHPLVGDKYIVYPTLDFESAIEDHLLGITHIIRGKDLIDSERRQKYIYKYFGWEYPITKHWGRIKIHEFGKLSTSEIRKKIESGEYEGWDDPALPTIRAFRRRGFRPEAIRKFLLSLGVGENDVAISLKNLYAENRKIIDKEANRYFFVWDVIELEIEGLPEKVKVKIPKSPESKEFRELTGERKVLLTKDDWIRFKNGEIVRLKDFCTVEIDKNEQKLKFVSWELNENVKKGKNIIHWLCWKDAVVCVVLGDKPNLKWGGFVERNVLKEIDKVVQFERFAFCRIEFADESGVRAIYTHP